MGPSASIDARELLGPAALALAPRASAVQWMPREPALVRLSCKADALEPADRRLLEDAALARPVESGTRWTALVTQRRLAELASTSGAAVLLALAARSSLARARPPRMVGVLNVTPDSFSDGGRHAGRSAALARARVLIEEGADWIDVGGESTRPGAEPVAADEELARVLPVIAGLEGTEGLRISIDTTKAEVAARALEAGAHAVNDVSAGTVDPELFTVAAAGDCPLVLMHMAGTPREMQTDPRYEDVLDAVAEHLRARAAAALAAGVRHRNVWIDPGIGFGKTLQHNLELLGQLGELRSLGLPLFVGVSRKSFIGKLNAAAGRGGEAPAERLGGTAAAVAACVDAGVEALRVHDVAIMAEAARVAHARVRALAER